MSLTLAFMGTPDFAVPTLEALLKAGHDVVAVYTQPPAPAGRGKKVRKSPVHQAAEAVGIPVFTPKSLKADEEQKAFSALNLDATIVVAYGQILPNAILDAPKHGCFNVHASLLPRWRGAAPIHRAIMAGDEKTGVCIMKMDSGLDTGPVIARADLIIDARDTTQKLHDKLAALGAEHISDAVEGYVTGSLEAIPQIDTGITYANKIDKAEAKIDWSKSAADIDRQVRGLNPFPGAWFESIEERIKVLEVSIEAIDGPSGTVLDDRLLIACGRGSVRITKAQRAGKGVLNAADLLKGWSLAQGSVLT